MSLPPETEKQYVQIIDGILASSDLNTISAKRIRKGLQGAVDHDITPHKDVITGLIMRRFDHFTEKLDLEPTPASQQQQKSFQAMTNGTTAMSVTNGNSSSAEKRASPSDSSMSSSAQSPLPKKHKASRSVELSDAAFAARLQAEENGRARSTRGGGTKRKGAPTKRDKKDKKRKKKSKNRVNSDDDSDAATGDEKKEVKRTGGFHKPMTLSAPLAELLGETSLSRPQTVKKIWQYIKAHDLQDPLDKRQIRCDDPLRSIFKQDRVHMFTMNKILNQNLYAQDE